MTDRFGRQPKPFARWQLGPWVQTGHQNVEPTELANIRALLAADAPVSRGRDTHALYAMRLRPGPGGGRGGETGAFHRLGLAALSYTREAICATYPSHTNGLWAGAFIRTPDGSPYTFPAFVGSGQTEIGMLDFSNPDAQEIYRPRFSIAPTPAVTTAGWRTTASTCRPTRSPRTA